MSPSNNEHPTIIFDCDGVLVDSETLAVEIEGKLLRNAGFDLTDDHIRDTYVGLSYPDMIKMIERTYERLVPERLLDDIREQTISAIDQHLEPVLGMANLLERHQGQRCVASSSRLDRIETSLRRCGLDHFFAPGELFSTQFVSKGKPAPDVYLHAAKQLAVAPQNCIVVEDSPTGAAAGVAAGMTVLGFTAAGHAGPALAERLVGTGVSRVCSDIDQLIATLRDLGALIR